MEAGWTRSERYEALTSAEPDSGDTIEDPPQTKHQLREAQKLHALRRTSKCHGSKHYTPKERTSKLWPNLPTDMRKNKVDQQPPNGTRYEHTSNPEQTNETKRGTANPGEKNEREIKACTQIHTQD
jgi:hypothetical protein